MFLDLAPQLRDQALRLFGQQLGEAERGRSLDNRGPEDGQHQRSQNANLVFADDIIHQELLEPGRTSPATLLITISTKPRASLPRRGRTSSFSSGSTLRK